MGLPDAARDGPDLETLMKHHPVIVPTRGNGIRRGFDSLLDRRGLRPRIAAEVDDMAMIRLLAREGIGLAVVPPIVIKDELATGRLAEISPIPELVETFYAVTVTRRFPNPLVGELLDAAPAVLG